MLLLLKVLQTRSKSFLFFMTILGFVNAVTHSLILFLINSVISFTPLPYFQEYNWLVFGTMLLISFTATIIFQRHLIKLSCDLAYDLNVRIFERIRNSSFSKLQNIGGEKVYAIIDDIDTISMFPVQFITLINSLIIVLCGLGYMFYSSLLSSLFLVTVMTILAVVYIIRNRRIEKSLNKVRDLENDFFEIVNDLIKGFRELTMSTIRNNNLHEKFLTKNRRYSRDLKIKTAISYLSNDLSGQYSWYLVLGIILYGFAQISDMGITGALTFTFVLLYIMGPLTTVISFIPVLTRSKIAYERAENFIEKLSNHVGEESEESILKEFQSLRVKDLCFEYSNEEDGFQLGPIDFELNKGEVVFIQGGNGSGKSTFLHLLCGLYKPTSGDIFYNEQKIDVTSKSYRDLLSTVFTEPFLFSQNYENYSYREVSEELSHYSKLFAISKELKIDFAKDKIVTDLSKGQQKRVALILALLENKPIVMLDEWAAEQDPEFRKFFYTDIIQTIKEQGKTLVLVTHDDRYFYCADRIVKMEIGKILEKVSQ